MPGVFGSIRAGDALVETRRKGDAPVDIQRVGLARPPRALGIELDSDEARPLDENSPVCRRRQPDSDGR